MPSVDVVHLSNHLVIIRGKCLDMYEILNPDLKDLQLQTQWADALNRAAPYPHLAVSNWFNPLLLELIAEEFDSYKNNNLRHLKTGYQDVHRSTLGDALGPATELYFAIINSNEFVQLLSRLTGIANLIVDHTRYGGGMHDTLTGGHFDIHSDYNRHIHTGLTNKMVFITYLTPNWQPEWNGELELWDAQSKHCVTKIAPAFGQSVLLLNGKNNYHGHPSQWNAPAGISRRSVANYYFANDFAKYDSSVYNDSIYIKPNRYDKLVSVVRPILPPVLWSALKTLLRRP